MFTPLLRFYSKYIFFGRTSVHLCAASLQNLAVRQYFYSPLCVPLEWSCWPRTRWFGIGGCQEQGQCFFVGLSCSIPTIVFYSFSLSLLSIYRLVLWGWALRTDRVYITLSQPCTAASFKNNISILWKEQCFSVRLFVRPSHPSVIR